MSAQIFKTRPPLGFTRPPWRIVGKTVIGDRDRRIAVLAEDSPQPADDAANAILIAVTPAMYLCLRAVRAYYTAMWSGDAKKKAPPFLRAITDLLDAIEPKEPHES